MIPVFIVSLPEDTHRRRGIAAQLDPAIFTLAGHRGFLGHTLPDGACLALTRDPNAVNNKGALGCMMSHLLVWQAVAKLDAPFALVVEDDVALQGAAARLSGARLPEAFDFILCGDQTEEDDASPEAPLKCRPLIDTLERIERRQGAPQTCGYLLSPTGAAQLLRLFNKHLYNGHTDVRMMTYASSADALQASAARGRRWDELVRTRATLGDDVTLNAYAISPCLVRHIGLQSRRLREDALGKPT